MSENQNKKLRWLWCTLPSGLRDSRAACELSEGSASLLELQAYRSVVHGSPYATFSAFGRLAPFVADERRVDGSWRWLVLKLDHHMRAGLLVCDSQCVVIECLVFR